MGNYAQDAQGVLEIAIGGAAPATEYGRLSVSGKATLDGEIIANLIDDFAPAAGDSFSVVFYGSRSGEFATITPQNLPPGTSMGHVYAPASFILNATVAPALASIAVTPVDPSVAKGLTAQLKAVGTYTDNSTIDLTNLVAWASADASVAAVDAGGLATALKLGSAKISATLDGVAGSTTLTVTPAELLSIAVSPLNPTIVQGSSQAFQATGTYTDDSTADLTDRVAWTSSKPAVATIDASGLANALSAGSTTIAAALGGASASTTLTVEASEAPAVVSAMSILWGPKGMSAVETAGDGLRLLPAGRSNTIGWLGINRISLALDKPATLTAADVAVSGLIGGNYGGVAVTGSGLTWLITLKRPIDAADRVTITIGNADVARFTRRLDVLPGDVNDDNRVTMQDAVITRNGFNGFAPVVIPLDFLDVLGQGAPTLKGYNAIRRRIGRRLPPPV